MTLANKLGLGLRKSVLGVAKAIQASGKCIKNTTTDFALGVQGKDAAVVKQSVAAQFVSKRRGKAAAALAPK
jgi:hypothetical protein